VGSLLNIANNHPELLHSDYSEANKSRKDHKIIGSVGYICPDYAITGLVHPSVDLYGFGALTMQVILYFT
jgi:hypothetical protein